MMLCNAPNRDNGGPLAINQTDVMDGILLSGREEAR